MGVKSTTADKLLARASAAAKAGTPEAIVRAVKSAYALGRREGAAFELRAIGEHRRAR